MIIGKHLIAGEWVDGERVFQSDPAHGPAHEFAVGSVAHVDERMRIINGVLRFEIARELGLHPGSQTHGSKA